MKTVFLHGLGQTAQDWKEVVQQLSISDVDCPELFSSAEDEISYSQILGDLEQRYSEVKEPLRICGLSLGALLAIDFAIRHEEKVASLVLIGAQYKVPSLLIDFQNLIFRCMPNKVFESMGLSKSSTIKLAHSMRSLDFTSQLNNMLFSHSWRSFRRRPRGMGEKPSVPRKGHGASGTSAGTRTGISLPEQKLLCHLPGEP